MWIAKIKYKHDCILGHRCEKFQVVLQGIVFSVFKKGKSFVSSSMLKISGDKEEIEKFIVDLKKDKNILKLERKGDTFFLLEKAKEKAVQFYNPKIIFIKPVLIDQKGWEFWEIGSWEKEEVSKFVDKVEKQMPNFELLKFSNVKVNEIFFPKLIPNLTEKQKRAIELAIERGYYESPKETSLRKLAKIFRCSLATYQKHLQVAESKVIPDVLSYFK